VSGPDLEQKTESFQQMEVPKNFYQTSLLGRVLYLNRVV